MKTLGFVIAAMVLANAAWALDIQGKWGIGAGLFTNGGEISLIRGHSQRTAWLFDVQVGRSEHTLAPSSIFSSSSSEWFVQAGPGIRRYTRPGADLSPYGELGIDATYRYFRGPSDFRTEELGFVARLAFGAEYATPWRFSLAAHSELVTTAWSHVDQRSFGTRTLGHNLRVDVGVAPRLFARIYF